MNLIDIVANAIHAADPELNLSTPRLAAVAVAALTDEAIVANAVDALVAEAWEAHPDELTVDDLAAIARVVLRSVGGA